MNALDTYLHRSAIVGAAGKMGSGISLLLAQQLAILSRHKDAAPPTLTLVDVRESALTDLREYIAVQTRKRAEKSPQLLQTLYPMVAADKVADAFVNDTLAVIRMTTAIEDVEGSRLVLEAVPEIEPLKIETLRRIDAAGNGQAWLLSNTSSIPISHLDSTAGLGGRIVGLHFYNPPAVQKLVELIPASSTQPQLVAVASELIQRLGKTEISSADVAGFIGNGFFIRDTLHTLAMTERLATEWPLHEAVYAMDRVTRDGLLRPMGTFQLIDYVGLDVFHAITRTMGDHIDGELFEAPLIEALLNDGNSGGQYADGTQKDGFFRYDGRQPVAVFDRDTGSYEAFTARVDDELDLNSGITWKALIQDPCAADRLAEHFAMLAKSGSTGARLTHEQLNASRQIGKRLIATGVAASAADLEAVLQLGFHHAYGAINEFCIV